MSYACGKCGSRFVQWSKRATEGGEIAATLSCGMCGATSDSRKYLFKKIEEGEMGKRPIGTCDGCGRNNMALFKTAEGEHCGTCSNIVHKYQNITLRKERFAEFRENLRKGLSPSGRKKGYAAPPSGSGLTTSSTLTSPISGDDARGTAAPDSSPAFLPDDGGPAGGKTLSRKRLKHKIRDRGDRSRIQFNVTTDKDRELFEEFTAIAAEKRRDFVGHLWWIIEREVREHGRMGGLGVAERG